MPISGEKQSPGSRSSLASRTTPIQSSRSAAMEKSSGMHIILIDPILFIVPEDATAQEKINYLNSLELLREACREMSESRWYFSSTIADLLRIKEAFPDFYLLQRILNACNTQVDVDIKQLREWIDQLLVNEFDSEIDMTRQDLQQYLTSRGYAAADAQKENTTFQPEEFAQRWDENIQPAMKLLFAKLCVYAHLDHEFVADLQIATQALTDSTKRDVLVSTTMECFPVGSEELLQEPIVHTFSLLVSPDDLLLLLNESDEANDSPIVGNWKWDETEGGLRAAIYKKYADHYPDTIGKAYKESQQQRLPLKYAFGSHFLEDLKKVSKPIADLPKKVVEAAAAIIADHVHEQSHFHAKPLRESGGGTTPQRRRSNDKAWRVYVTVNHGGWRLNYWQGPDKDGQERIEFSVIQKHEDPEKIYYD